MARYLYSELAQLVQARKNCTETAARQRDNHDAVVLAEQWFDRHTDAITALVKEHMPSGSGFDNGTTLDLDKSHADKLVFHTAFHHMNQHGMYDGWTEHTVTVTPSLFGGFRLRVSGRNRRDIIKSIDSEFGTALNTELPGLEPAE